jgi:hypothetical protein
MIPGFVIAGIFAVVAALDKEHPRPSWARISLVVFALSSISTGLLAYLLASGRLGSFLPGHPWNWARHKAFLQGVDIGMLSVLFLSRQFFGQKPPEKNVF